MTKPAWACSYENARILVTGHTGFKGGWLLTWLRRLGAEVHGYALRPDKVPNLFDCASLSELCATSTMADVRDGEVLSAELDRIAPDLIFHLAAQPLVREGYITPLDTFQTNVAGTWNLLEAVRRRARPCALVVVTSDKCYRNERDGQPFSEDAPLGGEDPYSASKAAAELVTNAYRTLFSAGGSAHVVTVRAGNVIGGGDWAAHRLIPDVVRAIEHDEPLRFRCPQAQRPWQHVLEPLAGYLELGARLLASEPVDGAWNFGPSESATAEDVASLFSLAYGASIKVCVEPAALGEANVVALDSTKATTKLSWSPRWSWRQAVTLAAEWYRDVAAGSEPRSRVEYDIERYESLLD